MLRNIENATWTRVTLPAIGAASGFILFFFLGWGGLSSARSVYGSFIFGILLFTLISFLTLRRGSWVQDIIFAALVGAFASGFFELADYLKGGGRDTSFAIFISIVVIAVIPVVFYQTGRDAGGWRFPYDELFLNSWQNKIVLPVAVFFVVIAWLLLFLCGGLFQLLGMKLVSEIIRNPLFVVVVTLMALGFGVALARERSSVISALLNLVLTLFRVLAPFLAVIIILFLAAMCVTGINVLWDTDAALSIFITSIFLFILFVNAVVQTGTDDKKYWKFGEWLMMAGTFALPILAVLAAWGLSLRVGQYGWTPPRIYSAALVSIGLAYGIAYAFCVLWKRGAWKQGITRFNPPFACLVLLLAIAIHLPPLEPFKLSADDQVARLTEGKIDPADFDFAYLKFKLGAPGLNAPEEIKADASLMADKQIAERMAALETVKHYRRSRAQREKMLIPDSELMAISDYMVVYPAVAKLPEAMLQPKHDFFKRELRKCFSRDSLKHRQCIILELDVNSDGRLDIGLITGARNLRIWLQQEVGVWTLGPNLKIDYKKGQKVTLKSLAEAVKAGEIDLKPRAVKDVIIGGASFQ
ncbi:MAG: hypothetical protein COB93_01130 [Sneathiella sp.]|nr:MAG: hypothetical protein COB93_01130 [Sneathiella sp.]